MCLVGTLCAVEKLNEEGLPRHRLLWAMRRGDFVREARRLDQCLLCRARRVNEAGLCDLCYSMLATDELRWAEKWLAGVMP